MATMDMNKQVNAYYEKTMLDMAKRSLIWSDMLPDKELTLKEIIYYKIRNFFVEIKNRLHYALESLKGNYGNDDWDY